MKKYIYALLSAVLLICCLSACGSDAADETEPDTFNIVAAAFPEYDWVRSIMGDLAGNAEITMLLDSGVDLHSYQPSVDDMIRISDCDMFIYNGGESDAWVKDALREAGNQDMIVISLMDVLGDSVKEEELTEGMEAGEEHERAEDEPEYDEHVWLSLKNAQVLCRYISEQLAEADAANADVYRSNADTYLKRLAALDEQYEEAVSEARVKTVVFGDRFPFRYLMDDYGIGYYAAFEGCFAETEASFETIISLADKVDGLGLNAVLTIDGSDGKIAEAVVQNTEGKNQQVLAMDSMQSATSGDAANGADYFSIMERNLEVLKTALQ